MKNGFSLVETLVGLGVLTIVALSTLEIMRMSAKFQKEDVIKLAEQDFYREVNKIVSDTELCKKALAGQKVNGTEIQLVSEDRLKVNGDYSNYFKITEMSLQNISDPPLVDNIRSAQILLKIKRHTMYAGGEESQRLIPFYLRTDPDTNEILDCGNIYAAESYCAAMRGKWDAANSKCIYDERQSCWQAGGSYSKVNGKDTCVQCWTMGGWMDASGKCHGSPKGQDPLTSNYNGSDGSTPKKLVYANDDIAEVNDWKCRELPDCAYMINNICSELSNPVACLKGAVDWDGTRTSIPKCKTRLVTCLAPEPPPED